MSLLDDLLLGFDEALEWPIDGDEADDDATTHPADPSWDPVAGTT